MARYETITHWFSGGAFKGYVDEVYQRELPELLKQIPKDAKLHSIHTTPICYEDGGKTTNLLTTMILEYAD